MRGVFAVFLVAAALAALLWGCFATQAPAGPQEAQAPLPGETQQRAFPHKRRRMTLWAVQDYA